MDGILKSVENLMTFPWIAEPVARGDMDLHAWYFDMDTGRLLGYVPQTKAFEPLASPCPGKE